MFWPEIRRAYIEEGESYRTLEKRYGISYSKLWRVGTREGWKEQRAAKGAEPGKGTDPGAAEQDRLKKAETGGERARSAAVAGRPTGNALERAAQRLELKLFQRLDERADGPEMDAAELKRLVDSYLSLRRIHPGIGEEKEQEGHRGLIEALREGGENAD